MGIVRRQASSMPRALPKQILTFSIPTNDCQALKHKQSRFYKFINKLLTDFLECVLSSLWRISLSRSPVPALKLRCVVKRRLENSPNVFDLPEQPSSIPISSKPSSNFVYSLSQPESWFDWKKKVVSQQLVCEWHEFNFAWLFWNLESVGELWSSELRRQRKRLTMPNTSCFIASKMKCDVWHKF